MVEFGSEYIFKIFVSNGKELINWEIGTMKLPKYIDYKLPEIEDHFYHLPEIIIPEFIEENQGKQNSIYTIIGFIITLLIPWISFIKLVRCTIIY